MTTDSRIGRAYALVMSGLLHAALAAGLALFDQVGAGRTEPPSPLFRSGRSAAFMPKVFLVRLPEVAGRAPRDRPARPSDAPPDGHPPASEAGDLPAELQRLSAGPLDRVVRWAERLSELAEWAGRHVRPGPSREGPPDTAPQRTGAPSADVAGQSEKPGPPGEGRSAEADDRAPDSTDAAAPAPRRAQGRQGGAETAPSADPADLGVLRPAELLQEITPRYPPASVRRQEEGLVLVEAHVLASGRVSQVRILRSSGYDRLDRAALEAVGRARFRPARRGGRAVPSRVKVPVRFALKG